jgi:hypothetical protein
MPVFRHSGGKETSHDIGEKYRKLVAEYHRADGYIIERQSNHHATTEDIAAVTVTDEYEMIGGEKDLPNGEVFKEVRVEAKAGNLSRLEESFITELLRVFIDYQKLLDIDRWFEYHGFASDLAAPDKWEDVFEREGNDDTAVQEYYQETCERHDLNSEEEEAFSMYEYEDFKRFLTDVSIHEANKPRLREMIEDKKQIDRSKWDYYTREYRAFPKGEALLPNFYKITNLPEYIWAAESDISHYTVIFEDNPRHLPVYYDEGTLYSLLSEAEMDDSLLQLINVESMTRRKFNEWAEGVRSSIIKNLLSKAIKSRGAEEYTSCRALRHDYEDILIFQFVPEENTNEEKESVQARLDEIVSDLGDDRSLGGVDTNSEGNTGGDSNDPSSKKVEGRKVAMEWGNSIAHRYCLPQVKEYADEYFVFIETGRVFTERGLGNHVISGDRADELHIQLQKRQYHNPNNEKAQFRQWRDYLKLESPDGKQQQWDEQNPQTLAFRSVDDLSLGQRPPANKSEITVIKEREGY